MIRVTLGKIVRVTMHQLSYLGTIVGVSPSRLRRSGEPADQYVYTIKCPTCGVCNTIPQRYVEEDVNQGTPGSQLSQTEVEEENVNEPVGD